MFERPTETVRTADGECSAAQKFHFSLVKKNASIFIFLFQNAQKFIRKIFRIVFTFVIPCPFIDLVERCLVILDKQLSLVCALLHKKYIKKCVILC